MSKKLHVNEQLLVDLLYANNRQAFSFLHDTFCPVLHGSLLDLVETDKDYANAALDNAFSTVGQALEFYDQRQQKLFSWLLHMMHQLAIAALRQLNKWPQADQLIYISICLRQVLSTMNFKQRRVIELMYDDGYSKAQVAEALHIPVETVETLLQSGLGQLKTFLKLFYDSGHHF